MPIRELADCDVIAWRELSAHVLETNPLFEPECLIPAAKILPNGEEMSLVIADDGGKFYGCFPVIVVAGIDEMVSAIPGLRRRAFTTQVRRLRYDLTPLIRNERGAEAATALLRVLTSRQSANRAGILVLEAMDDGGPVAEVLRGAAKVLKLPVRTYRTWERPILRRRDEMTYLENHSREHLKGFEKKRRRLGELLAGEVRLVDRSSDISAIDELIAMEASGYKAKTGVALVSHPGEPEWLKDMCDQFRERNRVLLYSLQVGEIVVAMHLMIRAGDGLFGLQIVYNEEYSKFSPGILLDLDVIEGFHKMTSAQWLDSCTYEGNETFLRFYPDRRQVSTVLVGVGGPMDRMFVRLYTVALTVFGVHSGFRREHHWLFAGIDWVASKVKRPTS